MPLPRFDFAPHEWPPLGIGPREGLADAVFRAVWDGEEVEVVAREVAITPKSCLWFFKKTNAGLKFVAGARGYEFPSPTASNLPEELKKKLIREALTFGGFSTAQQIS